MATFVLSAFADEAAPDLAGQIKALSENGIRYLEPRSIEGPVVGKSDGELQEIRRALDAAGIGISALGSPIGKYDITADFACHLEVFRRALAACRILGCDRMRMFSFFVPEGLASAYRTEVMQRLNTLCREARDAGVTLCHENEAFIYGETPERVGDLFDAVPDLAGVFDPANFVQAGCDPVEGFRVTAPRLSHIHIKDAEAASGVNVPAGEGDGRIREILTETDRLTDARVFLTLEPHLHIFESYRDIDRHAFRSGRIFSTPTEAFTCAVRAIKTILSDIGFHEEETGVWKK